MRPTERLVTTVIAIVLALAALLVPASPAAAECVGQPNRWPTFEEVVPTARQLVVGRVTSTNRTDGPAVVFTLEVEEVLRGVAPPVIEVSALRSGLPLMGEPACRRDAVLYVRVGDRIALARGGLLPGVRNWVNTAVWIGGQPDKRLSPGLRRMELSAVRQGLGLEAPDEAASGDPHPPAAEPSSTPDVSGIALRPTGREWQVAAIEPPGAQVQALTAWRGGLVAIGLAELRDGEERPVAWLSDDGSSWQLVANAFGRQPGTALVDVVAYREGMLAIGRRGNRVLVWTSDDGRSWTRSPHSPARDPGDISAAPGSLDLRGVATHGRNIVISGWYHGPGIDPEHYPRIWTSSNGSDWRSGPPGGLRIPRLIQALTTDRRGFVGLVNVQGCGMGDVMQVVRSKDGRRWRAVPDGRLPCFNVLDLAHDPGSGASYAVGYRGGRPVVARSQGLRDWQKVYVGDDHIDDARVNWSAHAVSSDEGLVVVAGDGYDPVENDFDSLWVLTSVDGEDWELSTGWPNMLDTQGVQGVALSDGRVVVLVEWRTPRVFVAETDAVEGSSPFERLWRPLTPEDIPFAYSCGSDMQFTTTDLEAASKPSDVSASLAAVIQETGRLISDRDVDWYVVSQTDDRMLALAPMGRTVDDQFLNRTDEGWHFETGGSPCTPRAKFDDRSVGRWRLDPEFPTPGPKTRKLHVLGYLGCLGSEKAGKAMIHMTDDVALMAIPMRSTVGPHSGDCLGPTKMTVALPEPLGRRTLYDAGSLPIRGAKREAGDRPDQLVWIRRLTMRFDRPAAGGR